jgi:hypothetical protein
MPPLHKGTASLPFKFFGPTGPRSIINLKRSHLFCQPAHPDSPNTLSAEKSIHTIVDRRMLAGAQGPSFGQLLRLLWRRGPCQLARFPVGDAVPCRGFEYKKESLDWNKVVERPV